MVFVNEDGGETTTEYRLRLVGFIDIKIILAKANI